ncbi:MAG: SBBP repeat-containing protein [Candidatus Brocadiales bacterium]|nr:SBBP repeat-containing protein [Candidatus Brocadiales bacterium]
MKWGNKIFLCGIILFMAVTFLLFILGKQEDVHKRLKEEFVQKTQRLQMPFIANEHQMNERVAFFTNTFGGSVFVTSDGELVYSLPGVYEKIKAEEIEVGNGGFGREGMNHDISPSTRHVQDISRAKQGMIAGSSDEKWSKKLILKEAFIGGKVEKIQGEGKTVTNVSYFKGKDPSKWKSNISTYEVVNLGEVYKGIELKLRAYGNNIEKFFYVKPDVDPALVKITLSGAKALKVNKEGQLEAETELGTVTFTKPVAYQEIHGKRVDVDVSYLISDCGSQNLDCEKNQNQRSIFSNSINPKSEIHNAQSVYGFKVASYDRTKELIIDPLLASTYLGGIDSDYGYSIARDADKNIIVAGYTQSSDFPTTTGVYDVSYSDADIFVSKLDGDLTRLIASTYLGGSSEDYVRSIAIDSHKNIYVAGQTASSNFPITPGVFDASKNGYSDSFLVKLSGDLTNLIASTFLGGSSDDYAHSIVLDPNGISLYVTGRTLSSNFPTTPGAYNTTSHNGDAFIAKINWNFTHILASTYLGGTNNDYGTSIVLDSERNIYVSGETWSSDFPTSTDAYDTSFNGGFGDVFVSKFDRDLTRLLASTYLGGTTDDSAHSMILDSRGNIYVTGQTESSDFPTTPGAYDTSFHNGDVFVSKFSRNLTSLLASTYLGGADDDVGNCLAIGSDGKIYVAGYTGSSDFPTTAGSYNTSKGVFFDAFVSKLSGDLTSLIASTYLGGYYRDIARSITIDKDGNIYVAGETRSSNFPITPGSYDTSYNGDVSISYAYDSFVSKLDSNLSAALPTNKKQ